MTITLHPRGPFSLTAAAAFVEGFPGTRAERPPEALRYAWAVDGDWRTVQATLRQNDKAVHAELAGRPAAQLARQAARDLEQMLCLDVDGTGFAALGEHDRVVGALQRRFPGLRPVLFYTPYEAAAWTIISQRIRMTQAATIKARLGDELGEHGAFPAPARLAQLSAPQRGLTDRKIDQLRTLAAAAEDGALTRERLRAMTYEDGLAAPPTAAGHRTVLRRTHPHPRRRQPRRVARPRHPARRGDPLRLRHLRRRRDPTDHRRPGAPTEPGWRSCSEHGAKPRRARSPAAGAAQPACNPPTRHERRHPARLLLARTPRPAAHPKPAV